MFRRIRASAQLLTVERKTATRNVFLEHLRAREVIRRRVRTESVTRHSEGQQGGCLKDSPRLSWPGLVAWSAIQSPQSEFECESNPDRIASRVFIRLAMNQRFHRIEAGQFARASRPMAGLGPCATGAVGPYARSWRPARPPTTVRPAIGPRAAADTPFSGQEGTDRRSRQDFPTI